MFNMFRRLTNLLFTARDRDNRRAGALPQPLVKVLECELAQLDFLTHTTSVRNQECAD